MSCWVVNVEMLHNEIEYIMMPCIEYCEIQAINILIEKTANIAETAERFGIQLPRAR
jgi:hypothetical protein